MRAAVPIALVLGALSLPPTASAWVAYRGVGWRRPAVGVGVGWGGGWGAARCCCCYGAVRPVAVAPVVAAPAPAVVIQPQVTSTLYSLPPECTGFDVAGVHYYACGGSYYRPYFGNNGVYYQAVPNPL